MPPSFKSSVLPSWFLYDSQKYVGGFYTASQLKKFLDKYLIKHPGAVLTYRRADKAFQTDIKRLSSMFPSFMYKGKT